MKKILFFALIACSLYMNSCTDTELSSEPTSRANQLSIKFDKTAIPDGVKSIIGLLTRTGYQTKTSHASTSDSSSVEIKFDDVTPGTWHLKIEALNIDSVALYSGETDVDVLSNQTTQVSMTLSPTGKLVVNVDWSDEGFSITDYSANPIIPSSLDTLSKPTLGIFGSYVLYIDGKYKMWYSGYYGSSKYDIHYAESSDGISWQSATNRAIISPNHFGTYDAQGIHAGPVIYENGIYRMYFACAPAASGATYIGTATSSDGIIWSNANIPVIQANDTRFTPTALIKKDDQYLLYYAYENVVTLKHGVAVSVSNDGINWNTYSEDVLLPEDSWEYPAIHYPTVQFINNKYVMIYSSMSNSGFGIATSSDGLTWVKDNDNPVFEPSLTSGNWTSQVRYPYLIKVGDNYRLYYTGYKNDLLQIGFASVTL
jgi:predicted GH43/DUF377 family glycosyl hydrolase